MSQKRDGINQGPVLRQHRQPTASTGSEDEPSSPPCSAGSGQCQLSTSSGRAAFSTLSATYPLKLLAPTFLPSQPRNVGLLYTLAYGGGLIAGDTISLRARVEEGGGLVMLTQGSTKIFKHRSGIRPSSMLHPGRSSARRLITPVHVVCFS